MDSKSSESALKEKKKRERLRLGSLIASELSGLSSSAHEKIFKGIQTVVGLRSGLWGGFCPLSDEPDLLNHFGSWGQWAFPDDQGGDPVLRRFQGDWEWEWSQGWRRPKAGIADLVSTSDIQGILVPGVGFDYSGMRLGRGRGFYDRLIAKIRRKNSSILVVGVGFGCQLVDSLPSNDWDERLSAVVTEQEVRYF